jgi:hypothetical protein
MVVERHFGRLFSPDRDREPDAAIAFSPEDDQSNDSGYQCDWYVTSESKKLSTHQATARFHLQISFGHCLLPG